MTSEDGVESLIRRHIERRPLMRAPDVYKLLYQGVFGIGHILREDALDRLKAEARRLNLDELLDEPLTEEVSVDGSVVRVNLRPYIRRGLPLDRLLEAMRASAIDGEEKDFFDAWAIFKILVSSGKLNFDRDEIAELDRTLEPGTCPPHHHSEAYRKAYAPSYRVVKKAVFESLLAPEMLR